MRTQTTDTRNGMSRPANAGPHWSDFIYTRQARRFATRCGDKTEAHCEYLERRKAAHLAMLSRRRVRLTVSP